jgi:nucleoside 2-deoxyribosyltransferase
LTGPHRTDLDRGVRRIRSLYLAGPDLFHPRALDLAIRMQALCEAAGFSAMTPHTDATVESEGTEALAREIYAERVARIRRADAMVVNLTPFRGPHCDPAAAFEAGFMAGLGKPVFAYLNVTSEEDAELLARVEALSGAEMDEQGAWRDDLGAIIENYGLPESLMLWAEARRLYVVVTPDPGIDLTGLELCLEAVKLYSD